MIISVRDKYRYELKETMTRDQQIQETSPKRGDTYMV